MPTSGTCIKCHVFGIMYDVRHGMCKGCYMKDWHVKNKERIKTNFGKCSDCGQEKKIVYVDLGLCSHCHDNRRYGSRENYRKYRREYTRKYRKTPQYAEYKIKSRSHQIQYNVKWRKENPQKHRHSKRRWEDMHQAEHRIGERRRSRRYHFFRRGKPVGPFDPNEILDKRLLKALEEVSDGNLKPPKRDDAPSQPMSV